MRHNSGPIVDLSYHLKEVYSEIATQFWVQRDFNLRSFCQERPLIVMISETLIVMIGETLIVMIAENRSTLEGHCHFRRKFYTKGHRNGTDIANTS